MSDTRSEEALRANIVRVMRAMDQRGLNRGTSGNVSVRFGEGLLVTPSGVTPEDLTDDGVVYVAADGGSPEGSLKPSSEWRMHAGLYARRPDVHAVVHCHARHATILACAGRPIPSLHYMVGVSGRPTVPLAPYHTFGTVELADAVAEAMDGGYACLMANHGLIAAAPKLDRALAIAEEMEEQAAVYCGTLAIGGPVLLSEGQMAEVMQQFKGYGQKR
ncbi:class II aldolase/adducin family protein [Phenylobacterium montanum]|uniref:Class II aldolase/adducin family protein n=1 Tax=Phenylobacterium montanum TaxID=2823693 RepID=A0A975G255_9CAUL|nr:class II aldolase/adducin family protein [Caulobacter sp. S6]QUD88616.1 class II aldolase/adducin family protein [Caulobacter sp. S6]